MASDTPSSPVSPISEEPSTFLDASPASAAKKSRRQTAFYPNMNSSNKPVKPFSRSAAKRESVMTLGSIEHLQHYFTKTGIAAKKNPLKPNSGAVPVFGGPGTHFRNNPSLGGIQEMDLPPSPAVPTIVRPPYPLIEKNYETDPENLKPGVIQDLEAVSKAWGFTSDYVYSDPDLLGVGKGKGKATGDFDVLSTLKLTTRAIRSVRNYLVSLPDESAGAPPHADKGHFRPRTFTPPAMKRLVSQPNSPSDPLTLIRRSALDVLSVLRALEESSRLPLSDDAYDAQSEHDSTSGGGGGHPDEDHNPDVDADTSFAFSVVSVPGRHGSVPVWSDEDADDFDANTTADSEKRQAWEERLVLGGGWLYNPSIHLADVQTERTAVGKYLDAVDEILFGGPRGEKRGWEGVREKLEREGKGKMRRTSSTDSEGGRSRRLVSANVLAEMREMVEEEEGEEDSVDDEELPDWAKRSHFVDDHLARAHALLTSLLPASLLHLLPASSSSHSIILSALSSGQLLCNAYNTGVRRSRKPWGYINKDAIHDIAMLEAKIEPNDTGEAAEKRQKGWTFRRIDNLRLWAAALKLRYLIPVIGPNVVRDNSQSNTPLSSPQPSTVSFPSGEKPVFFDAKVVARKDEGWEAILENLVMKWVNAVVEEKRG
ncbi:hypothetical protein BD410DRAFT_772688 [Rickenella mellea]|uniref:Uncharacterized protein n=1 Tax=Rickenella mellea TaxID=50990 RepID=A0A4Y7Q0V1_9AGAM|nr:hypothetical protein BD410DRAFT_772688 [Rickenella mellea]